MIERKRVKSRKYSHLRNHSVASFLRFHIGFMICCCCCFHFSFILNNEQTNGTFSTISVRLWIHFIITIHIYNYKHIQFSIPNTRTCTHIRCGCSQKSLKASLVVYLKITTKNAFKKWAMRMRSSFECDQNSWFFIFNIIQYL